MENNSWFHPQIIRQGMMDYKNSCKSGINSLYLLCNVLFLLNCVVQICLFICKLHFLFKHAKEDGSFTCTNNKCQAMTRLYI